MRLLSFLRIYLTRPRLPFYLAVLAVVLTLPALGVGIVLDDNFHEAVLTGAMGDHDLLTVCRRLFTFMDGDESYTRYLINLGMLPWWTLDAVVGNFWRPVTALTHWIDYQLWPEHPWLMHAQSLLWFGAVVAAVTVWYRRLMGPTWVAGLAALLYAIDDGHSMPVTWLANRNSVIATLFGVLALIAHDRWRRDGWRLGALLAALCFELALFSAEAGVAAAAYLVSYALFLDAGDRRARFASLMPCGLVGVIWLAIHHGLGYGAWGMDLYIDPAREPLRFLAIALQRAPLLLLGALGGPPADLGAVLAGGPLLIGALVATSALALLALALRPLLRNDATMRFLAFGTLLSLPPICATFPSDRLLMYVTLGGMGMVAKFLAALVDLYRPAPALSGQLSVPETAILSRSRANWILSLILVASHLVVAPLLLPARGWALQILTRTLEKPVLEFPDNASVNRRELILINPPSVFLGGYFALIRLGRGLGYPSQLRSLAPGFVPLEVTRIDERTLAVQPEGGYVTEPMRGLVRDSGHPLEPGQVIHLTDVEITVGDSFKDGWPLSARFRFHVPLESETLNFVEWRRDAMHPFTLPKIGQTVTIPAFGL